MERESKESALQDEAARQLRSAGFMVGTDVALRSLENRRVDLVGWQADHSGRLRAAVIVEVKAPIPSKGASALSQLATFANSFGAASAYLFDGSWHLANDTFTELTLAPPPEPGLGGDVQAGSELQTREAFGRGLRELAGHLRAEQSSVSAETLLGKIGTALDGKGTSGAALLDDLVRSVPAEVLLSELRAAIEPLVDSRQGGATTPRSLADAMARLASPQTGNEVEDPFCGLGNCLWSAHAIEQSIGLRGTDIDENKVKTCDVLARLGRVSLRVDREDFFATERTSAGLVVTDPPMGVRLPVPWRLSNGDQTTDTDVAILDRLVARLPEGGRLVQVVPPKILFADGAARKLRDRLASSVRVVAIVELPPKVFSWAAIRCAVLVIEKTPPARTLVARLGDDWPEQLSVDGAFYKEYRSHLGDAG